MEISDIVYLENVTQEEAQKEAEKLKGRILTNKEIDVLLQQEPILLNPDLFPLWTGTHLGYLNTACTVTENGKTTVAVMPEKDGWYEQDEFGLPFGKPSKSSNKEARHLWRLDKNSGLVVRRVNGWYDLYRRYVDCCYVPGVRLGVLILRNSKRK